MITHIAILKGEYGHNTILVKEKNLEEEFNFTCHNYGSTKNTNILFGIENSNSTEKFPATRVLKNSDLEANNVGTNTKPYPVQCKNVCQVNFIVIYFDTSTLCNETNSENWNCGIKEMEEELNFNFRAMPGEKIVKTYSVYHPNKLPPFTKCEENNTDSSFLGINSCIKVLNNFNFDPEISPVEIVIEMIYSTVKEEIVMIGRSFITKKYCPRAQKIFQPRNIPTPSISNHSIHNITSTDLNDLSPPNKAQWIIPLICITIVALVTLLIIGYCLRKKRKKEVGLSVISESTFLKISRLPRLFYKNKR